MPPHDDNAFFAAFEAALAEDPAALNPWLTNAAPGLGVYRNTIVSGAIDALAATFTTVQLMTGRDWFRAAGRTFAQIYPPAAPDLISYGADFPAWLGRFPPAQDAPYLADTARLDWLWWQCWSAGDAPLLDPADLSGLPPEDFGHTTLGLHPTLRIAACQTSVPSLWLAHQSPGRESAHQLATSPEQILFIRTAQHVQTHLVDVATFAFLEALQRGESVLAAAERAFAEDPDCSLTHMLAGGIAFGLFTGLRPSQDPIS